MRGGDFLNHKKRDVRFSVVQCTMPTDLKKQLKEYAFQLGLSLTSTLILILNQKFNPDLIEKKEEN